jgi:hypothetical protein
MVTVGALAFASGASAALTYGNIVQPPGVIFGSGNVNGNFTINTDNNVEVALRAKNRYAGNTIDGSDGSYNVEGWACGPLPCGGATSALRAKWNYEYAVNVRPGGTASSTAQLADFIVELMVDIDPTAGTLFNTLNVLSPTGFVSSYWDGSSRRNGQAPAVGEFALQGSQNPFFADSGFNFVPGWGLFDMTLAVYRLDANNARVLMSSVTTQIQVPEPGSLALAGLALLGAAAAGRRRRV